MTSHRGARVGALAAVAILTAVVALLLAGRFHHKKPAPQVPWYTAFAAPYTPSTGTEKGACGRTIGPTTIGVAHPVLPCGAKLEIRFGSKDVVVRVVDRSHAVPGHTFDLTPALAHELGLQGTQSIQWRFAR